MKHMSYEALQCQCSDVQAEPLCTRSDMCFSGDGWWPSRDSVPSRFQVSRSHAKTGMGHSETHRDETYGRSKKHGHEVLRAR